MSNRTRVAMLVNNDWRIDSRVMREAATLAAAGHEVHVVSRVTAPGAPLRHGEVQVHEIAQAASIRRHPAGVLALWRLHLQVAGAARRNPNGSRAFLAAWASAAVAAGIALLVLVLLPLLAPPAALLLLARRRYRRSRWREPATQAQSGLRAMLVRRALGTVRALMAGTLGVILPEHVRYLNGFGVDGLGRVLDLSPDVVHAHDLVTLSTGRAAAVASGCRLVYDAHELETHTNYWSLAAATHRWIATYESSLIRRCDAVVTVCDSIADWLAAHYGIERPVVVLNSPDLQGAAASPFRSVRSDLGLAPTVPLAVYVGAVSIDRGLPQCVQAAAQVPGLHLALVGPRDATVAEELRALARLLAIEDRVHLVDPVPSSEVAGYVASADCSLIAIQNVCLSYYYCFPNKLLESVMSGLPVAAARLAELERFLDRFPVGVLMDEREPASIAQAIRTLLQDPGQYRPGPEVLATIRRDYGWPAQQSRLRALYDRLSGAPSAPPHDPLHHSKTG
ncbi:glycosyltransferase family 4 protein [Ramlibacter tataouinensis]|uniref:glycosyltransferase family 4 protein n=1 Tax=Ramlibacter tataouinensis TaxID=94132 RepID=UPI0022F37D40|nr:glycosyltransferase family 4 protein [Ramlibacter tataouinensis]WBY00719.1 glycosyltransferase family 4 protein [Ramlibacter tataouinensis]